MENYLCQDVLGIIFSKLPFDLKNIFIVNKYCYKTFLLFKKNYCEGNYFLTDIQRTIIDRMIKHLNTYVVEGYQRIYGTPLTDYDKPLIIQANISVGKTAAILAFASKYQGTVVILMPLSVMSQWQNEYMKMYGNNNDNTNNNNNVVGNNSVGSNNNVGNNNNFIILHENYTSNKIIRTCRKYNYNPASIGYKIIAVSSLIKFDLDKIMLHSVVIMDEVHTKGFPALNPKFIGVTASKAVYWKNHCHYQIYDEEETLPRLQEHHIVCNHDQIAQQIAQITSITTGPYLIIGSKTMSTYLGVNYIHYDSSPEVLVKINGLKEDEFAFLEPGNNCTGINLIHIGCVIFIHPTNHINATVIQAKGRVQRVTSKNKLIPLYNIHENQSDILLYKTYLSENDINAYCTKHKLNTLIHLRDKYFFNCIIKKLLARTTFEELDKIKSMYFALLMRIPKTRFDFLARKLSKTLPLSFDTIYYIISKWR